MTLIDFPQMISTSHPNAEEMFDRDVNCLVHWFAKQYGVRLQPEEIPKLGDIVQDEVSLDHELRASGFTSEQDKALLAQIRLQAEAEDGEQNEEGQESDSEEEDDEGDEDDEDAAAETGSQAHDENKEEEAFNKERAVIEDESEEEGEDSECQPVYSTVDRQKISQRVTAQRKKQGAGGGKRNSNKTMNGRRQNRLQASDY